MQNSYNYNYVNAFAQNIRVKLYFIMYIYVIFNRVNVNN